MTGFVDRINLRIPAGASLADYLNHELIEYLPIGVYLCDAQGLVVAYNHKAVEIWGAPPEIGESQVRFCGAHKLLTVDGVHVPHEETPLAEVIVDRKPIINFQAIIERRDGSRVPVVANVVPLFDAAGEMIGFMNSVQDQRFQQLQEQERARLERALFQSQKMEIVGQLTSGLAHDFNNQLACVTMAVQLMRAEVQDGSEQLKKRFDLTLHALGRASALAENLMRFSRLRPREIENLEPGKVILNMEGLLQAALGTKIKLSISLKTSGWRVAANLQQLESAFLNLAINSRDAMPNGGDFIIEVSETQKADNETLAVTAAATRNYVLITVTDTGCGMSESVRDNIFTPFFTTKSDEKGTGLGLAMVNGFVSETNGRIEVVSTVGIGTTFNLYLPVATS